MDTLQPQPHATKPQFNLKRPPPSIGYHSPKVLLFQLFSWLMNQGFQLLQVWLK